MRHTVWFEEVEMHIILLFATLVLTSAAAVEDCTPKDSPDKKCEVIDSGSACTGQGPAYVRLSGPWPGAPRNFSILPYVRQDESKKYNSGFIFTWDGPENASLTKPTGFELKLKAVGYGWGSSWCRLFNMSQASWNTSSYNYEGPEFEYDLDMDDDRQTYHVTFYSLPRGPPNWKRNYVDTWWTRIPKPAWSEDVANNIFWQSTVVVRWIPQNHELRVFFTKAPDSYRFPAYVVGLQNRSYALIQEHTVQAVLSTEVQSTSIVGVCPGVHDVTIRPHDPDPKNERGECVCTYRGGCIETSRGTCYTTIVSRVFLEGEPCPVKDTTTSTETMTTAQPRFETSTAGIHNTSAIYTNFTAAGDNLADDSKEYFDGLLVGILTSSAVVVVMAISIAAMMYMRRHKSSLGISVHRKDLSTSCVMNNWSALNDQAQCVIPSPLLNTVRVFILYNPDNAYHEKVVTLFATFLQKHGACDVRLDRWFQDEIRSKTKLDWLQEEITCADKVIVVNSEGSYRRWEAMKERKVYLTYEKSNIPTDTFLIGTRVLNEHLQSPAVDLKRFISVRFEYTKKEFEIPTLCVGLCKYELMSSFDELYFHLHSMNSKPGLKGDDDVTAGRGYQNFSSEGHELHESIVAMVNFVNEFPHWFVENHGEPIPWARDAQAERFVHAKASGVDKTWNDASSVLSDDCITLFTDEIFVDSENRGETGAHSNRLLSQQSIAV